MTSEGSEVVCEVVVCGDGECMVSTGTQTVEGSDLVQITASLPEMTQRINSFMRFKRQQVDLSNQLEFCQRANLEGTCARTSAAYVKRGPHASHISAYRVHNVSGPTGPPLPPLEQLKRDLCPPPSWILRRPQVGGANLLGLQERISNMEQYTDLYTGGPTPRDVMQRIHNLELRLLQLEGQSPEYARPEVATKSLPKPHKSHRVHPYASGHHVTSHDYGRK